MTALRHLVALALCCAALGPLAAAARESDTIGIELRASARLDAGAPALGDVASIDGDGVAQRNLRALRLPAKGKVGDTVVYSRAEIAALIDAMHGARFGRLHWSGPERVLVERHGVRVQPEEYIGWAEEQLRRHWAAHGGRLELKAVNEYRPLTLPAGRRSIEARFASDEVLRTARVWLDIAVDGQHYTTALVTFDVGWWQPALVLKQRGSAQQRLRPEMIEEAVVDTSLRRGALVLDAQRLLGKRLRRDTEAGTALAAGDVEDIPAVELGATVRVFAGVGRIAVQTQAVALRDGAIGQRIAVRNPRTNEQLMVEVIGENSAMVSDKQTR